MNPEFKPWRNSVTFGDALTILTQIPDKMVSCTVTSPPYYGLRTYLADDNPDKQYEMGSEESPEEYIKKLVMVFQEVRRVTRDDGLLWLNLGDSYSKKGLLQIPVKVAIALQEDGWYLRQDIILAKSNCMPSSVTDRFTSSYEHMFMFSKSKNYYFKQQFEPLASPNAKSKNATNKHAGYGNPQYSGFSYDAKDYPLGRNKRDVWHVTTKGYKGAHFAVFNPEWIRPCIQAGCPTEICDICDEPVRFIIEKGEPLREWQKSCGGDQNGNYTGENTKDYASAKAQPASDLKRRVLEGLCVKKQVRNPCDCENATFQPGIVLDPFLGSGTTAMVAAQEKCQFAGIELNTEYVQIILDRINSAR